MLLKAVATIGLIVAGLFSAAVGANVVGIIALVLFFVAVASLFFGNSPLTVVKHRNGRFWIKGFSDEFLENFKVRSTA